MLRLKADTVAKLAARSRCFASTAAKMVAMARLHATKQRHALAGRKSHVLVAYANRKFDALPAAPIPSLRDLSSNATMNACGRNVIDASLPRSTLIQPRTPTIMYRTPTRPSPCSRRHQHGARHRSVSFAFSRKARLKSESATNRCPTTSDGFCIFWRKTTAWRAEAKTTSHSATFWCTRAPDSSLLPARPFDSASRSAPRRRPPLPPRPLRS